MVVPTAIAPGVRAIIPTPTKATERLGPATLIQRVVNASDGVTALDEVPEVVFTHLSTPSSVTHVVVPQCIAVVVRIGVGRATPSRSDAEQFALGPVRMGVQGAARPRFL